MGGSWFASGGPPVGEKWDFSAQSPRITDPDVLLLAFLLARQRVVVSLLLSGNSITSVGSKTLASAFTTCSGIHTLDLSHNLIDDTAVRYLVQAGSSCLYSVKLSHNRIGDSVMGTLCDVLQKKNCRIVELDLSFNSITDRGSMSILPAAQGGGSLKRLSLAGNQLQSKGGKVWAKMLEEQRKAPKEKRYIYTLTELNLNLNPLNHDVHTELLASVHKGAAGKELSALGTAPDPSSLDGGFVKTRPETGFLVLHAAGFVINVDLYDSAATAADPFG